MADTVQEVAGHIRPLMRDMREGGFSFDKDESYISWSGD